jgi:hypothetical protein
MLHFQDSLTGRRIGRNSSMYDSSTLNMRKEGFVNFVFFVWSSVRRRQDRTGQGDEFRCDTVADFSVTERRKYSFDRPNIWQ